MCEFPKRHLFLNNSIPLSQQVVFWGREGTHTHAHARALLSCACPGMLGDRRLKTLDNWIKGTGLSLEGT